MTLDGIGPKTTDYLRNLLGSSTIAVDRHIMDFTHQAGIFYKNYDQIQALVRSAASVLCVQESLLDHSIWLYVSSKRKKPPLADIQEESISVPLLGRIAAGSPIFANENLEGFIPVSVKLARPPHSYFLLRVIGDSMNKSGINDGDLALVRQQPEAQNGDRVVAFIDGSATIKEFHRSENVVILRPKSTDSTHKPIILTDDIHIQGIVIGTIPDF